MSHTSIFSTAYFPPIRYFSEIKNADSFIIESHENYNRQSYRNRCNILSCNGILTLSIPVIKGKTIKEKTTDVKIDYSTPWQRQHIYAIVSAYGKSPFFTFYSDQIIELIQKKNTNLFELNYNILNELLGIINLKKNISLSNTFQKETDGIIDFRNIIHPKSKDPITSHSKPYIQTFCDRYSFISDLSILDLIFNTGPETKNYL